MSKSGKGGPDRAWRVLCATTDGAVPSVVLCATGLCCTTANGQPTRHEVYSLRRLMTDNNQKRPGTACYWLLKPFSVGKHLL
jgi:hypothetical protein